MLKVTNHRTRGSEPPFDPIINMKTPEGAFHHLVEYELAYGGVVKEVEDTKLVIVTRVMGCVDTTIFEGPAEDLRMLQEAAGAYLQVQIMAGKMEHNPVLEKAFILTQGKPLLIQMGAEMIVGSSYTAVAMKAMVVDPGTDKDTMKALDKLSLKNLCAVVLLVRRDGASLEEALELALSSPVYDSVGKIKGLGFSGLRNLV